MPLRRAATQPFCFLTSSRLISAQLLRPSHLWAGEAARLRSLAALSLATRVKTTGIADAADASCGLHTAPALSLALDSSHRF
jgi:hypothetical protein